METLTPATTPPQETRHRHATNLRRGTLSAGFTTLLVISAASPLSLVAGGFSIGMMLGNGAGTLVLVALGPLLMFATGYIAMAICLTGAGCFYAMVARGRRQGGAGRRPWWPCSGTSRCSSGSTAWWARWRPRRCRRSSVWRCRAVPGLRLDGECGGLRLPADRLLGPGARGLRGGRILGVAALDALILSKGGAHGIYAHSSSPGALTSVNPFIGLLFCFAAFIGFEATTIYSEQAKDPKRSIPVATYAALLLVGGIYSFSLWCLVIGAGSDRVAATIAGLVDPTNLLYLLSDTYAGHGLAVLLRLMFIGSIYAGLIAFHNSSARYFYAMGREGLIPARLGWTHVHHRSPHVASVLQTVLGAVAIGLFAPLGTDPVLTEFAWLSNLAILCLLVLIIATAVAVVRFFRAESRGYGRMRIRALPLLACAGFLAVLVRAVGNFHVLRGPRFGPRMVPDDEGRRAFA